MQIFRVIALVAAICASSASARCYISGEHRGDHDEAKAKLNDTCNSMQGSFGPGQIKVQCRGAKEFESFHFEIQNNNEHDVSVSHDACFKTIEREIDHCGRGGQDTFDNIRYRYVNMLIALRDCYC